MGEWYNEIVARDAAEQSRRLTLPAKPEDYKAELPKDFVKPEGIEVQFKEGDPLLTQARAAAKEMNLSQDQFSRLLSLHAGAMVNQQATFKAARDAEIAKLGPTAPARVDAITTFYKARLGDAAAAIINSIWTADAVKAHERIIQAFASQGSGGFSQSHREPGDGSGRLNEQQIAAMSVAERLDYARRMSNGRAT